MSVAGVSASYWSAFNRVGGTQQRASTAQSVSDIAQSNVSTTVSISPEARAAAASLAANNTPATPSNTVMLNTSDGEKNIDIDAYFNPSASAAGWSDGKSLPPLLLPSAENINALAKDASSRLKAFLAANNIPSAPSSISYDENGQIQLPTDYQYSDQLKQALKDNPALERELSTVNALTSQLVSMHGSAAFSNEYSKATTKAEAAAILAKYHSLFDGTQHQYKITLGFDESGNIAPLADGQPYADILASTKTANVNDWTTDTTITTPDGKVIKTQWVEVNKMLDASLSSDDKAILGFPFSSKNPDVTSGLTLLAMTIKQQRELGYLKGPLTKDYLFGSGDNKLDLKNDPNFNTASAKAALDAISQRIDHNNNVAST